MKPPLLACALLAVCSTAGPQQPHHLPDSPSRAEAAPQPDPVAFEGVRSSLASGRKEEALEKAQAIVQMYPDNLQANLMTGAVLLDLARPADAIPCFRKAVAVEPDDAHLHTLLLEAYAESGDRAHRDQEIAVLRRFHSDGRHPLFAQVRGLMIERIAVGNLSVEATQYFQPEGQHHFSWRFNVYDKSGRMLEYIALASEEGDQASFAKDHPKEAAAGTRRFLLARYTENGQTYLGFIDGRPSYDDLRARVVNILQDEANTAAPAADKK
jgi:tetratricopeptide (TPR) repeat protein